MCRESAQGRHRGGFEVEVVAEDCTSCPACSCCCPTARQDRTDSLRCCCWTCGCCGRCRCRCLASACPGTIGQYSTQCYCSNLPQAAAMSRPWGHFSTLFLFLQPTATPTLCAAPAHSMGTCCCCQQPKQQQCLVSAVACSSCSALGGVAVWVCATSGRTVCVCVCVISLMQWGCIHKMVWQGLCVGVREVYTHVYLQPRPCSLVVMRFVHLLFTNCVTLLPRMSVWRPVHAMCWWCPHESLSILVALR